MRYTSNNLPSTLLTPPVPPPTIFSAATWQRNWTVYAIARQWAGPKRGMMPAIADWLYQIDPATPRLSRQRIQMIRNSVAYWLTGYSDDDLGIESVENQPVA